MRRRTKAERRRAKKHSRRRVDKGAPSSPTLQALHRHAPHALVPSPRVLALIDEYAGACVREHDDLDLAVLAVSLVGVSAERSFESGSWLWSY